MSKKPSIFCISLDTEFFWGVHDTATVESYGQNVYIGKHQVIESVLRVFDEYKVHATWVVVGAIMANDYYDLEKFLPHENLRPTYRNSQRTPYSLLKDMGKDVQYDDLFFGQEFINKIHKTENQEVGSHTFSHYYCCEEGQTVEQFCADVDAAVKIANAQGIKLRSIVFPKNEMSDEHMKVCAEKGILAYRGIEENWIYSLKSATLQRILRFADSYFNLSGSNVHEPRYQNGMLNIVGSRIFRPYMRKLAFLENFKLRRIKGQMKAAAKNGGVFHLWWHPHNFGCNTEKNIQNLKKILEYYLVLKKKYNLLSLNMEEIFTLYEEKKCENLE